MTQRPAGEEHAHRLGEARGGRDLFDTTPVVERLLTRRFTDPKMKNKFVSTAQQLRNEGKAENQVSTLLRLVTKRFGAPEAAVVERIRNGTTEELEHWIDRILDATSVAELFAD